MSKLVIKTSNDLSSGDLERLIKSKYVAVDCEMSGLDPHNDKLCLVQLYDGSGVVNFIKSDDWKTAPNLKSLLENQYVQKIFHFAVMDCSFLTKNLSCQVANIYCTKIASKLADPSRNRHSLFLLVKEYFNHELDKNLRETNWCVGELTEEQKDYASEDVRFLIDLRNVLESQLLKRDVLPSGASLEKINANLQQIIPNLVQLLLNGWDFGLEDEKSIFGK